MSPLADTPTQARRLEAPRSLAILVLFALAIVPSLLAAVVPTIDFYNHVARYFVLAHVDKDPFLAANYSAAWAVLPNIGLDVLGTGLLKLVSTLVGAHLIILAVFASQYFGVLYFNRQIAGRSSLLVALLLAPLLYSFIFAWGFANFLLGLGLVFFGAGLRLRFRDQPALAFLAGAPLAVVIFLTHGVAFALYGLLAGALELGQYLDHRRLTKLAKGLCLLAAQAVLPAALFAMSATSKTAGGFTNADESIRRLHAAGALSARLEALAAYRAVTILRVAESPSFLLDVVTFVAVAAVLILLARGSRLRIPRIAWPAILLSLVLVAITPPTLFGVGYIADRMPLFAAFTIIGSLQVALRRDILDRGCVAVLVVLVVSRLVLTGAAWDQRNQDLRDFRAATSVIPANAVVGYVDASMRSRLDEHPRCTMYGPLLIPLRHVAGNLFAVAGQQPLQLKGRLAKAVADLPRLSPDLRATAEPLDLILKEGEFDYVLVCDEARFDRASSTPRVLVGKSGRFSVYKIPRS